MYLEKQKRQNRLELKISDVGSREEQRLEHNYMVNAGALAGELALEARGAGFRGKW